MIHTEKLTIALGGHTVLHDISVKSRPGRVAVVLGPNGAGKSTLIRAFAGLLARDDVWLDGQPLAAFSLQERARTIGYLPQNGEPAWNVTVRELVSLGRIPHRSFFAAESSKDRQMVDEALHATDCTHLADRTVNTLSGGELARVKLARLFAGDPDWLLADEPLANLDPAHQREMLVLLRRAASQGKGVIIVLHQLDAALHVADDAILLKNGSVLAHGEASHCLTQANLELLFETQFELLESRGGAALVQNWSGRPS